MCGLKKTPRLRAGEESDDTQTAYRVAAFQTFLSGRISTFGDTLAKLATHRSMALLPSRRQTLIDRAAIALLRIITEESQTVDGER